MSFLCLQWGKIFPKCFFKLTNYSLTIFCSEPDNLHFDVGSTDGCEHQFHLIPHAEHRAAENVIGPTPEPDFTLQAHWRFLTVPSPGSRTEFYHLQNWKTTDLSFKYSHKRSKRSKSAHTNMHENIFVLMICTALSSAAWHLLTVPRGLRVKNIDQAVLSTALFTDEFVLSPF